MNIPVDADRDFTASTFIVEDGKVLFLKHSKTGYWLQPGGHVEEGETPDETALREAREETGAKIVIHEDFVPGKSYGDFSHDMPKPFNINLHRIKEGHWHYDLCFLASLENMGEASHGHEHEGIQWLSRDDIESDDYEMPENVRASALKALRIVD